MYFMINIVCQPIQVSEHAGWTEYNWYR